MDNEDLCVWPDGTSCFREELKGMSHLSDDYTVLPFGSPEWWEAVNREHGE